MALLTQLFSEDILNLNLNQFKQLLKSFKLAPIDQKKILLREFATLKNIKLTEEDYNFIS